MRAYRIADNLAEKSEWNDNEFCFELGEPVGFEVAGELDFDLSVTGFSTPDTGTIPMSSRRSVSL